MADEMAVIRNRLSYTTTLDPSNLPAQTAFIPDQPFCHDALDRQTHTETNRSLQGMFDISHFRDRERRGLTKICRAQACSYRVSSDSVTMEDNNSRI